MSAPSAMQGKRFAWVPGKHPNRFTLAEVLDITETNKGKIIYTVSMGGEHIHSDAAIRENRNQGKTGEKDLQIRKFFAEEVSEYNQQEEQLAVTNPAFDVLIQSNALTQHYLKKRLEAGLCYTNCGKNTLVFLNPFTDPVIVPDRILNAFLMKAVGTVRPGSSSPLAGSSGAAMNASYSALLFQGTSGSGKSCQLNLCLQELAKLHKNGPRGTFLMRNTGRVLGFFGNTSTVRNKDGNRFSRVLESTVAYPKQKAKRAASPGGAAAASAKNLRSFFIPGTRAKDRGVAGDEDFYSTGNSNVQNAMLSEEKKQVLARYPFLVTQTVNKTYAFEANKVAKQNPGESNFHLLTCFFAYLKCIQKFSELKAFDNDKFPLDPDSAIVIDDTLEQRIVEENSGKIHPAQLRNCMLKCDQDLGVLSVVEELRVHAENQYRYMNTDLQQQDANDGDERSLMLLPDEDATMLKLTNADLLNCARFLDMRRLLEQYNVSNTELGGILKLLNVILKIGNIDVVAGAAGGSSGTSSAAPSNTDGNKDDKMNTTEGGQGAVSLTARGLAALEDLTALLGLKDVDVLKDLFLVEKSKKSGTAEPIRRPRGIHSVLRIRDGIAANLYESIFTFVKTKMNTELLLMSELPESMKVETEQYDLQHVKKLLLVDAFGFESVQENTLDQFLKNYAAETLRRFFEVNEVEKSLQLLKREFERSHETGLEKLELSTQSSRSFYDSNENFLNFLENDFIPLLDEVTLQNMVRLSDNLPGDCDHADKQISTKTARRSMSNATTSSDFALLKKLEEKLSANNSTTMSPLKPEQPSKKLTKWQEFCATYHYKSQMLSAGGGDEKNSSEEDDNAAEGRQQLIEKKFSTFLIAHYAGYYAPQSFNSTTDKNSSASTSSKQVIAYSTKNFIANNCRVPSSVLSEMKACLANFNADLEKDVPPSEKGQVSLLDAFLHEAPLDFHKYEQKLPKIGLGVIHDSDPELVKKSEPKTMIFAQELRQLLKLMQNAAKADQLFFCMCVKPNPAKAALNFDTDMVTKQLAGLGILELQKVCQSSFDLHLTTKDFLKKYRSLVAFPDALLEKTEAPVTNKNSGRRKSRKASKTLSASISRIQRLTDADAANLCKDVLEQHYFPTRKEDDFLVGKTHVFLRVQRSRGYENLQTAKRYVAATERIQALVRGMLVRKLKVETSAGGSTLSTANNNRFGFADRKECLERYQQKRQEVVKKYVADSKSSFTLLLGVLQEAAATEAAQRVAILSTAGDQAEEVDASRIGAAGQFFYGSTTTWQHCCLYCLNLFEQRYPIKKRDFFSYAHCEETLEEMEQLAIRLRNAAFDTHVRHAATSTKNLDAMSFDGIVAVLAEFVADNRELQENLVTKDLKPLLKLIYESQLSQMKVNSNSAEDTSDYEQLLDCYAETQRTVAHLLDAELSSLERQFMILKAQLMCNFLYFTLLPITKVGNNSTKTLNQATRQIFEDFLKWKSTTNSVRLSLIEKQKEENATHLKQYTQHVIEDIHRLKAVNTTAPMEVKTILVNEAEQYLKRAKRAVLEKQFAPVLYSLYHLLDGGHDTAFEQTLLLSDKIALENFKRLRLWQGRTDLVCQWVKNKQNRLRVGKEKLLLQQKAEELAFQQYGNAKISMQQFGKGKGKGFKGAKGVTMMSTRM
ncbi:unnamed protein product [Amoebophrya sp. A120]|nr:unnamed protein product [Amoebophrya sp. A120]|eukprot:GSA120T00015580001.1